MLISRKWSGIQEEKQTGPFIPLAKADVLPKPLIVKGLIRRLRLCKSCQIGRGIKVSYKRFLYKDKVGKMAKMPETKVS